jgi:hypothetical protein
MAGEKLIGKALQAVRQAATGRNVSPLGLYSKGAEEAAALKQAKGTPEQMRAMLLKQGVKPGELENAGFNAAFAGRPSVTKDEIAKLFQDRAPKIEEKRLSGRDDYGDWEAEVEGVVRDARQVEAAQSNPTKYQQYTIPGGENYREVLLKLPQEYRALEPEIRALGLDIENVSPRDVERAGGSPELVERFAKSLPSNKNEYRSTHWDDPNVLAHLRMSDRMDPEGRKILHLEELQSDWAQEGRKQGFKGGMPTPKELAERNDMYQRGLNTLTSEDAARYSDIQGRFEAQMSGVPTGPYVTKTQDWTDLALKRALREAAEGDYDAIAWTPGKTQAARYPGTKEEGMIGYYDKIVPTQLQKMTRNLDPNAQLGTIGMYRNPEDVAILQRGVPSLERVRDNWSSIINDESANPAYRAQAQREFENMNRLVAQQNADLQRQMQDKIEMQTLPISAEMREKIKQGLPLFTAPAIGLGAATQMQSGENPVTDEQRSGFADGGGTGKPMTIDEIIARIRSGEAQLGEFDPRIPQLDANRAFQPPGSKFSNQALPILPTRVIPPEPRIAESIPMPPMPQSRPAEFDSAPSEPRPVTINRQAPSPTADDNVSRALWQIYNESESPADFLRADEAMRAGRAGGGRLLSDQYPTSYMPNVGRQVMADGGEATDDDIRQYERAMAAIARQPEDIRSMTHSPSTPMRPIEIEGGFTGKRQLGNAPYNVAGPMSGAAQFAYDLKTLPFYFTPAAPLALASDTGEAAINMAKSIKKGDYLGAGLEGVLGVAPGAIAFRKPIAEGGRRAIDYARSLGRQYAEGGSVEQEQPGLVDRAMSFLSQFNPVGSAEASPASAIAKRVMRGTDLIAKDPKAADVVLSKRDLSGSDKTGMRVKDVEYAVTPKGDLQPYQRFNPEDMYRERGYVIPALGDRSAAGRNLEEIGGVKLTSPVSQQGGGEFMRSTEDPAIWASRKGPVKSMYGQLQRQMKAQGASEDAPIFMSHTLMGYPSLDSTNMMAEAILRQIQPTMGKIDPKAAAKVDTFIKKKFPDWPGILNPEEAEQFLRTNEVGKRTSTILQALDKADPVRGGLPNLGAARFATMDPRLVSADQLSSGFSISRLDPRGKGMPTQHGTYTAGMGGDYKGGTEYQIPARLMYPDWFNKMNPEYLEKRSGKMKATSPTMYQQGLLTQFPLQKTSQEWLDNIMAYTEREGKKWGYRDGGFVYE